MVWFISLLQFEKYKLFYEAPSVTANFFFSEIIILSSVLCSSTDYKTESRSMSSNDYLGYENYMES